MKNGICAKPRVFIIRKAAKQFRRAIRSAIGKPGSLVPSEKRFRQVQIQSFEAIAVRIQENVGQMPSSIANNEIFPTVPIQIKHKNAWPQATELSREQWLPIAIIEQ